MCMVPRVSMTETAAEHVPKCGLVFPCFEERGMGSSASPTERPDPQTTDVPIDPSNDPRGQVTMALFLRNAGARVWGDQPPQQSPADAVSVLLCRLAGVQLDTAQVFGALICILLRAEQAK